MGVLLICNQCQKSTPPDLKKGMVAAPEGWWLQEDGVAHVAACSSDCLNLFLAGRTACLRDRSSERDLFSEAPTE